MALLPPWFKWIEREPPKFVIPVRVRAGVFVLLYPLCFSRICANPHKANLQINCGLAVSRVEVDPDGNPLFFLTFSKCRMLIVELKMPVFFSGIPLVFLGLGNVHTVE